MNKAIRNNYVRWVVLSLGAGALSALLTRDGTRWFNASAIKPALTPPAWVFPAVWAVLYVLMGVSAARIAALPDSPRRTASLRLFCVQLGVNFCWSLLFFNLRAYAFAFLWLTLLWGLIVWMILSFFEQDGTAARLQIPYALWVFFAGYLNLGVWLLNR